MIHEGLRLGLSLDFSEEIRPRLLSPEVPIFLHKSGTVKNPTMNSNSLFTEVGGIRMRAQLGNELLLVEFDADSDFGEITPNLPAKMLRGSSTENQILGLELIRGVYANRIAIVTHLDDEDISYALIILGRYR